MTRRPKVAIDVSGALGTRGGIHVYLQQMINHLPSVTADLQLALYSLFWNGFPEKFKNFTLPFPSPYEILLQRLPQQYVLYLEHAWGLRLQEFLLRRRQVDVYHGACQIVPPTRQIPTVVTVHHHDNPRYAFFSRWQRFYFKDVMERSARMATLLIADSKFTKHYLMNDLGIDASKITVVYHGAPERSPADVDLAAARRMLKDRYALDEHFVVCVSHVNKRKNITGLIRAFRLLSDAGFSKERLVIVGQQDPNYMPEVEQTLQEANLGNRILFTGGVSPDEVPYFYRAADLFVLPSFLEGFGIPLVEAMQFECPIVASNVTCIPEVVGDAGLLVSPESAAEIAQAMAKILSDSQLRQDLIQKGKARAKKFSWKIAAERTADVYRRALMK